MKLRRTKQSVPVFWATLYTSQAQSTVNLMSTLAIY